MELLIRDNGRGFSPEKTVGPESGGWGARIEVFDDGGKLSSFQMVLLPSNLLWKMDDRPHGMVSEKKLLNHQCLKYAKGNLIPSYDVDMRAFYRNTDIRSGLPPAE